MKCLILAAGYGSRVRTLSRSKPLLAVLGTPLIEHVVRRAAAAGVTAFVVVTGHEAPRLERILEALAARLPLPIEAVRLDDWSRPNGFSVLAGAERIQGEYLLLMADHLFDPDLARCLLGTAPIDGIRLAVDRNLNNPLIDLEDATKVELNSEDRILKIGKGLERYDAIDTGLFLANPSLKQAIEEAIQSGQPGSVSDGVQRLADQGRAATMDVKGGWWLDVDDPPSHALAETYLKTSGEPA